MTILAWHNDPSLKASAVERMRQHRAEDELIQGVYATLDPDKAAGYRGCFHGCLTVEAVAAQRGWTLAALIDGYDRPEWHFETERIFGIPQAVGDLLDDLFESVPADEAGAFAVAVTEAIPVGADLSVVIPRMILELLADDPDEAVVPTIPADSPVRPIAEATVALYRRHLAGDPPNRGDWAALDGQYYDVPFTSRVRPADRIVVGAITAARYGFSEDAYPLDAQRGGEGHPAWLAARTLHHLAAAPIPAPDPT